MLESKQFYKYNVYEKNSKKIHQYCILFSDGNTHVVYYVVFCDVS